MATKIQSDNNNTPVEVDSNKAYTLTVQVDGKTIATGTAFFKPSASGRPNLNIFGKVVVDGQYCQLGLNITKIVKAS